MRFEERLKRKVQAVFSEYKTKVKKDGSHVNAEEKYEELFTSMKRWHHNSHVSKDEWKSAFDKIKLRLNVRGKLSVPYDLQQFLNAKFAKSDIKDKFIVCEIFDFLEDDIRQYLQHISEANDEEDFDIFKICSGLHPDDIPFFEKSFLPVALFNTYLEVHPFADRKSLMNDLFSLGAGSKTQDLFPEVTALCSLCVESGGFTEDFDIDQFNRKVMWEQLRDNFSMPMSYDSSDDEEGLGAPKATGDDVIEVDQLWYNPFSSSSDESDFDLEELLEKNDNDGVRQVADAYKCNLCPKSFTKAEFLSFHKGWFHKVKISYVAEGEELMESFAAKSDVTDVDAGKRSVKVRGFRPRVTGAIPSKPSKKTATMAGSRKSVRKALKY